MKTIFSFCLLATSLSFLADPPHQFEDTTIGLKISKPASWRFTSSEEHLENLGKLKKIDEGFKDKLLKYSTTPLVAMNKYEETFDDLNPHLKIFIKPLGELKGQDPKEIVRGNLAELEKVFKDYEVVQKPTDIVISNLNGAYARITYTAGSQDGQSFPACSEFWFVPRGNHYFLISAGTPKDDTTGIRLEIRDILDTLVIEPHP
ncbi:hypothetical protein SCOR_10250 [Sulfidibacter corallicola]|uniref:Uncharacterized protein n=1 Tax=Sulfidibacter corallicola TaxID=2818388 RepID=A0A8A4TF64_SULCO|nr:hypothetical protein [Sulfidibacter corallicola]QTD48273.1 hypothetical protein J3U87_22060 [Sulfidibacter corallicola]